MATIIKKSFSAPDETRAPDKTNVAVVDLGSAKVAQLTVQPGWSWSSCVKPVVGGDSCQVHHVGACISGHMKVRHDDGTEVDIKAGDAYVIEPGHDGWVVGEEPVVMYEFDNTAAATYAKK